MLHELTESIKVPLKLFSKLSFSYNIHTQLHISHFFNTNIFETISLSCRYLLFSFHHLTCFSSYYLRFTNTFLHTSNFNFKK